MADKPGNKPSQPIAEPIGKQVAKEAAQTQKGWDKVLAELDVIIAEVESLTAENTAGILAALKELRKTIVIESAK